MASSTAQFIGVEWFKYPICKASDSIYVLFFLWSLPRQSVKCTRLLVNYCPHSAWQLAVHKKTPGSLFSPSKELQVFSEIRTSDMLWKGQNVNQGSPVLTEISFLTIYTGPYNFYCAVKQNEKLPLQLQTSTVIFDYRPVEILTSVLFNWNSCYNFSHFCASDCCHTELMEKQV